MRWTRTAHNTTVNHWAPGARSCMDCQTEYALPTRYAARSCTSTQLALPCFPTVDSYPGLRTRRRCRMHNVTKHWSSTQVRPQPRDCIAPRGVAPRTCSAVVCGLASRPAVAKCRRGRCRLSRCELLAKRSSGGVLSGTDLHNSTQTYVDTSRHTSAHGDTH